ncbi:MAG: hypothetical protein QM730_24460 [Anaerolineales bacterium]
MFKRLLAFLRPVIVFFTPPIFPEDEEKTRRGRYAHWISLAFLIAALGFEIIIRNTRTAETLGFLDFALIGIALFGLLGWWLVRRGYVMVISILLVVVIWTASNGIATDYGIRDASFILNFATIAMSALLLGWVATLFVGGLSIVSLFLLANAEAVGNITNRAYPVTNFAQDVSVVFLLATAFIAWLISDLERAIKRSRANLKELEASNAELNLAQTDLRARSAELVSSNEMLQDRTERLRAVAEVARTATAVQSFDRLLPLLTTIISKQLGYYHVGIFLVDENKEFAILRSANTDGGLRMLARGHRLKVGEQGIVGFVTQTGNPRIAMDVGKDLIHF